MLLIGEKFRHVALGAFSFGCPDSMHQGVPKTKRYRRIDYSLSWFRRAFLQAPTRRPVSLSERTANSWRRGSKYFRSRQSRKKNRSFSIPRLARESGPSRCLVYVASISASRTSMAALCIRSPSRNFCARKTRQRRNQPRYEPVVGIQCLARFACLICARFIQCVNPFMSHWSKQIDQGALPLGTPEVRRRRFKG